jgi:dihydromethanopterin reductase (acceptor)
MSEKRLAWAITGAGHALEACVDLLLKCGKADLFLSRAGEEVLHMYGLHARLNSPDIRIYVEDKSSSPLISRLFSGIYSVLVVAPATSNSVAKFVHGISDTLVTNLFAQAGKSRVPAIVYPTDLESSMNSSGPHREPLKIYPRPIDLENTQKLQALPGVTVVSSTEELEKCLDAYRRPTPASPEGLER